MYCVHLYVHYVFIDPLLAPMVNTTSTANTTFASWNMDENAVQYNVTLSRPSFMMQQVTVDTSVTFEGLVPATMYTLTVHGIDAMNRSGDPTIVNVTTDRTRKCAHVNALHYMKLSNLSVWLN